MAPQNRGAQSEPLAQQLADRPRLELDEVELARLEEHEFAHGPLALLQQAVVDHEPVVILCRNNHKMIARVKAFDRHCNLVLENVREVWTERGRGGVAANKERFVSKMFLRGDSVIVVVRGEEL